MLQSSSLELVRSLRASCADQIGAALMFFLVQGKIRLIVLSTRYCSTYRTYSAYRYVLKYRYRHCTELIEYTAKMLDSEGRAGLFTTNKTPPFYLFHLQVLKPSETQHTKESPTDELAIWTYFQCCISTIVAWQKSCTLVEEPLTGIPVERFNIPPKEPPAHAIK